MTDRFRRIGGVARATLVASMALAGCVTLWPSSIDRHTTVQFLAPDGGGTFCIIRTDGDAVAALSLTDSTDLRPLTRFLDRRGLDTVDALVFLVRPRESIALPAGFAWRAVVGPAGAGEPIVAADPRAPALDVVVDDHRVTLADVTMKVQRIGTAADGATGAIAVEVRHGGNRLLVAPAIDEAEAWMRANAGAEDVDLAGVVAPEVGARLAAALPRAFVVVRPRVGEPPPSRASADPRLLPLGPDDRVALISEDAGLSAVGEDRDS